MRPIGEILKGLGFNKEAPLNTQKAFFRHLVQHAETVRIQNSRVENKTLEIEKQTLTESSTQLSFDANILGLIAK